MTAQTPDFFPPLPFRVTDATLSSNKATNWSALQTFIRRNSPGLATAQVSDAVTKMEHGRKIIVDTFVDAATTGTLSSASAFQTRITESFLTTVVKDYLELLFFAQAHFPLTGASELDNKSGKRSGSTSNSVSGLQFTWTVFGDPSIKNSNVKGNTITSTNANFEACSILLNAALCWGRIAQQQVWQYGTEGAKNAFKYFQAAAGIIAQLRTLVGSLQDEAESASNADPNLMQAARSLAIGDLSPRGLAVFEKLFLACAHHCGYLQAVGKMATNYTLLSKMAMDGSNLYKDVVRLIKEAKANQEYNTPDGSVANSSGPAGLNTEYSCMLSYVMLEARSQYHLAQLDFQDRPDKPIAPGAGVGRLNRVLDLLEYAMKTLIPSLSSQERVWCDGFRRQAEAEHKVAMKDIELVHMGERILKSVPEPEANNKPLGKPTPSELYVAPGAGTINTKRHDPFFGVVPIHILGPINEYRNKVRTLVSQCSDSLGEHKRRMRDKMTAMGVSGAIQLALGSEDQSAKAKLPKDMRTKIFQLRYLALQAGAGSRQNSSSAAAAVPENDTEKGHLLDCLVNQLDHGQNVAEHVQQRVKDIIGSLDEDKHDDHVKMTQYGTKVWKDFRKPIDVHPDGAAFRRAAQGFATALKNGVTEPLERSKRILQANIDDLVRLDFPMVELDALMPFMNGQDAKKQSAQVISIGKKLQELGHEVDGLVGVSERTLGDLRMLVDSDNVAYMLSCAPNSQHASILEAAQQEFSAGINSVSANRNRMDILCNEKIASTMEELAMVESTDTLSEEVRALCRSLESSITAVQTVSEDILEACRIGDTLSEQVENTFQSCQSFTMSRKMEAEEYTNELDRQVSERMALMKSKEGSEDTQKRQDDLRARIRALEGGGSGPSPPGGSSSAFPPAGGSNGGGSYASSHVGHAPQFTNDGFPTVPPQHQQPQFQQPPPQQQQQFQPPRHQPMGAPASYAPPTQQQQPPPQFQQQQQPPQQQQQQNGGQPWFHQHAPQSLNQGSNPNVRY